MQRSNEFTPLSHSTLNRVRLLSELNSLYHSCLLNLYLSCEKRAQQWSNYRIKVLQLKISHLVDKYAFGSQSLIGRREQQRIRSDVLNGMVVTIFYAPEDMDLFCVV